MSRTVKRFELGDMDGTAVEIDCYGNMVVLDAHMYCEEEHRRVPADTAIQLAHWILETFEKEE